MPKRWNGTWPAKCDLCKTELQKFPFFVDGATKLGPWGLLCPSCHVSYGVGIGPGRGQAYNSKTREKLDG